MITAPWRYKENGGYQTGGCKEILKHLPYHRDQYRVKVAIYWTCPFGTKHNNNNMDNKIILVAAKHINNITNKIDGLDLGATHNINNTMNKINDRDLGTLHIK